LGIDYVEMYVANLTQAAHYYRTALGLQPCDPVVTDQGNGSASQLLQRGNIGLRLTSPLRASSSVAKHLAEHGDGVKDVALRVRDMTIAMRQCKSAGAMPVSDLTRNGSYQATIAGCGSMVHTLVERTDEAPIAMYGPSELGTAPDQGLTHVDHVAISVEQGTLDQWAELYREALGLQVCHREQVITKFSAMNSLVLQNEARSVTFSMMEPLAGLRRSQIEEFLDYNGGPGAQHVALASRDIAHSVRALRAAGVEFLPTPGAYYDALEDRIGPIGEELAVVRELGILVDRDDYGYLLQIFSKPVQTVPTLFLEVIERRGARGFGSGNIRALFEAVEREQAARGNL